MPVDDGRTRIPHARAPVVPPKGQPCYADVSFLLGWPSAWSSRTRRRGGATSPARAARCRLRLDGADRTGHAVAHRTGSRRVTVTVQLD